MARLSCRPTVRATGSSGGAETRPGAAFPPIQQSFIASIHSTHPFPTGLRDSTTGCGKWRNSKAVHVVETPEIMKVDFFQGVKGRFRSSKKRLKGHGIIGVSPIPCGIGIATTLVVLGSEWSAGRAGWNAGWNDVLQYSPRIRGVRIQGNRNIGSNKLCEIGGFLKLPPPTPSLRPEPGGTPSVSRIFLHLSQSDVAERRDPCRRCFPS